jgi:hypothetical protein
VRLRCARERLVEALLLRRALAEARARPAEQARAIRQLVQAAERRVFAASTGEPSATAALALCREAAELVERAREAADTVEDVAGRPHVRALLESREPLAVDRLHPADASRSRSDLLAVLRRRRRAIETRGPRALLLARALRLAALSALLAAAPAAVAAAVIAPDNLALEKSVMQSSLAADAGAPELAVDGKDCDRARPHTRLETSPWIGVDLGKVERLGRIVVRGEGDAYVDRKQPLLLELSEDGASFVEVSQRTTGLTKADPWIVTLDRKPARWVRVRKPARGDLTLCEIEVFD